MLSLFVDSSLCEKGLFENDQIRLTSVRLVSPSKLRFLEDNCNYRETGLQLGPLDPVQITYTRSFFVELSSLRKQQELIRVNTGMKRMFQTETNQLVKNGAL